MQSLSELFIILLGSEGGGKTSSGNTILGRKEFTLKKSAQCIKKHGVVSGWQITVIDTPGRKRDYLASTTPQLYKEEVVRSVALCPPGPHALLLVITVTSSFEAVCKQAVEEHLRLFGENVWNHIIVLFTHGDRLEDKTIQQHITEEGDPLQELLEKCGNRYHVFNNMERVDKDQVFQLLEKIEQMVQQNRGNHFEMDRNVLKALMKNKKEQDEKAQDRILMTKPKAKLQSTACLRMVLLGSQCSGKSSSGNTIMRADVFSLKTFPTSLHKQATVGGRQVIVIDTPGWLKDGLFENTPHKSKRELVRSVSLCPPGPHAFLLVIPVDTTFTDNDEKAIIDHLELFGDQVWSYTIVVFTHADWMGDTAIEMYIESEGEAIQRLVEKCGNRYHAFNNMDVGGEAQVTELLEKIEHNVLVVNRGSHFAMDNCLLDKMDHGNSEEEEGFKEKNEKSGTHLSHNSSGYVSQQFSTNSKDDPPVMSKESDANGNSE